MNKCLKEGIFVLRVAFGWLFFYSGLTKVLNPEWSAEGFLHGAKTFAPFFEFFASPGNIEWVNFLNSWGQVAIGAGLILGAFTVLASYAGILLMLLYYFPSLEFPYVDHGFLIDDHIIYALALWILASSKAGTIIAGVDQKLSKKWKGWWI